MKPAQRRVHVLVWAVVVVAGVLVIVMGRRPRPTPDAPGPTPFATHQPSQP